MEQRLKVVYDDGCPTCTVGMRIADRLDMEETMEFVGMNTEEGKKLIHEHGLDMNASAYVIGEDSITERAAMMRDVLDRGGIAGKILSLPFRIPYLSDKLYDLLALHRKHVTRSHMH